MAFAKPNASRAMSAWSTGSRMLSRFAVTPVFGQPAIFRASAIARSMPSSRSSATSLMMPYSSAAAPSYSLFWSQNSNALPMPRILCRLRVSMNPKLSPRGMMPALMRMSRAPMR